MIRTILVYGGIAGVIVAIPMLGLGALHSHLPAPWGMVVGYLTMLVALSTVFVAIKRLRDGEPGGAISFWRALGVGLSISLVASVFYVLAWEGTMALTGMDFARDYAAQVIAQEKAKGLSAAALARLTADMAAFQAEYADPLTRLPMTFTEIFPVGVLVSLVSAGLLRNRRFLPARFSGAPARTATPGSPN